ncbi:MAG TPA: cytochrome c biogenesis protein ResB [Pyrinomonadaceae bacterium]|jgi:cytochrome c biogenesis protein
MSAAEETKANIGVKEAVANGAGSLVARVLNKTLTVLSSVRFGVTLLVLLVIASMIGMLIMQQNVEGFERYYAELTPSEQLLGSTLGFFDIYHSWYFDTLLLVLSLNIVLASIDRFPKAWTFISRPKLDASAAWLKGQEQHAVLQVEGESRQRAAERIAAAARGVGFKTRITEKGHRTFVFAESNVWNRLGAYAVHVALLTIFTGGFIFAQFGRTGQMWLSPGDTSNRMVEAEHNLDQVKRVEVQLPFQVTCTDIQQKLIKTDGPITANNTIDWLTRIKIKDKNGERDALVHLNAPYDYNGYRLFQESFAADGKARVITVRLTPAGGGEPLDVTIPRNGSTALADGTRIEFTNFHADFRLGGGNQGGDTSDYRNPAAELMVTAPGGPRQKAYAFNEEMADKAPIAKNPVGGYTYRLVNFEKAPLAHALSIQYNPGVGTLYLGFALLGLTLINVFFFSHQRVWALVEERAGEKYEVILGGNTNRNQLAFEERFKRLANAITGQADEVEES